MTRTPRTSLLIASLIVLGATVAWAQMPRLVSIGTPPPGSLLYAVGSGLAKVVSGGAPFPMAVQPYSGTSTFFPIVNKGEVDFGVVNAVDLGMAYHGPERLKVGGRNPFPHTPNARLVMRGSLIMGSLVVRKDSPIKTVQDAKGKRVTGEYPAHLAVWYNVFAALANGGLTWNDVRVVPVPAVNDGIDALVQGRADASMHAVGSAKTKEADAAVGIRYVSLDCSPQGEERIKKTIPGYYLLTLKAGSFTGIIDDTCVFAYDMYFLTHKALPDAVAYAALKAVWENIDQLPPIHPTFKQWTRQRAVSPDVTIPYHPGAVAFYREHGVWKPPMDQVQQRLLALNP